MRILIIKTSSLGDIVHTFTALTDAKLARPDIEFDWLVEESFASFVKLHPGVSNVISVPLRRMKKQLRTPFQIKQFIQSWRAIGLQVNQAKYDMVIDAQGLFKSVFLGFLVQGGTRIGFSWRSIRKEKLAAFFYHKKINVPQKIHAIERNRLLFSQALGYEISQMLPASDPKVISLNQLMQRERNEFAGAFAGTLSGMPIQTKDPYIVFLIGSAWATKEYPANLWRRLSYLAQRAGFYVFVPWFTMREHIRSLRLSNFGALPFASANTEQLIVLLANAKVVVGPDTGLTHLANALGVPTVGLYSASAVNLTGLRGKKAISIAAQFPCSPCLRRHCKYSASYPPCFNALNPTQIWQEMQAHLPQIAPLDVSQIERVEQLERTGVSRSISDEDLAKLGIDPRNSDAQ